MFTPLPLSLQGRGRLSPAGLSGEKVMGAVPQDPLPARARKRESPSPAQRERGYSVLAPGRFHDLGQHAAHVLRVDEEDQRPMRADARLAEHLAALSFEPCLGRVNVGYFVAE